MKSRKTLLAIWCGMCAGLLFAGGCDVKANGNRASAAKNPKGGGDDGAWEVCVPGETQKCWCPDDEDEPSGAQRCATDGSMWWRCFCSTSTEDGGEFWEDCDGCDGWCEDDDGEEWEPEGEWPDDEWDNDGDLDDGEQWDDQDDGWRDENGDGIPDDEDPLPDDRGEPIRGIWIPIEGGEFVMGEGTPEDRFNNGPAHPVRVPPFEMMQTEATVAMYRECVDAQICPEPALLRGCNPVYDLNNFMAHREEFPINCINWHQATRFCEWLGARLPTESEWEYAARSRGLDVIFPWGDTPPRPELAVVDTDRTDHVCSRPEGNTEQGLCDIAGNVNEWIQDWHVTGYAQHPDNGSAFEPEYTQGLYKGYRGGCYQCPHRVLETKSRWSTSPTNSSPMTGVRCVR